MMGVTLNRRVRIASDEQRCSSMLSVCRMMLESRSAIAWQTVIPAGSPCCWLDWSAGPTMRLSHVYGHMQRPVQSQESSRVH
jgi:hypothetical protein